MSKNKKQFNFRFVAYGKEGKQIKIALLKAKLEGIPFSTWISEACINKINKNNEK